MSISDEKIADHIFKLRLGCDTSYGKPLHLLLFEDVTQSTKDHQNLARSQKQLRSLSRHLESIREEERARIAREIHDELGQILTALKLDLSWIGLKLDTGQKTLKDKADSMAHNIDSAIRTVQKISGELRPGLLDDLGLEAAIEWQAGKFTEQTGIRCSIDMPSENLNFSSKLATNLFRILQETLTNIARHAKAGRAWIRLEKKKNEITLTIRDNGVGLPPYKINHPLSLGLTGIRERVIYCGGEIEFQSGKPKGTIVKVKVPLEISADD